MTNALATIDDVSDAEPVIREHISQLPLIRSYPLERELGLFDGRRVWLKDYGWTPVGSFKLLGAFTGWHKTWNELATGRLSLIPPEILRVEFRSPG